MTTKVARLLEEMQFYLAEKGIIWQYEISVY